MQVGKAPKERGCPAESGDASLGPLSRAAGWAAAHGSFSAILGNTSTLDSGAPLSPATHQGKKWQNIK